MKALLLILGLTAVGTVVNHGICSDEPKFREPKGIIGEWMWHRSEGGLAGKVITPESCQCWQSYYFGSDDRYQFRKNADLKSEGKYWVTKGYSTFFGDTATILHLDGNPIPMRLIFVKDYLMVLVEACADCYEHEFGRLLPP